MNLYEGFPVDTQRILVIHWESFGNRFLPFIYPWIHRYRITSPPLLLEILPSFRNSFLFLCPLLRTLLQTFWPFYELFPAFANCPVTFANSFWSFANPSTTSANSSLSSVNHTNPFHRQTCTKTQTQPGHPQNLFLTFPTAMLIPYNELSKTYFEESSSSLPKVHPDGKKSPNMTREPSLDINRFSDGRNFLPAPPLLSPSDESRQKKKLLHYKLIVVLVEELTIP